MLFSERYDSDDDHSDAALSSGYSTIENAICTKRYKKYATPNQKKKNVGKEFFFKFFSSLQIYDILDNFPQIRKM